MIYTFEDVPTTYGGTKELMPDGNTMCPPRSCKKKVEQMHGKIPAEVCEQFSSHISDSLHRTGN